MARSLASRSPERAVRQLVRLDPAPLIDPDRRFVLIWSPKSACSTALIWFYEGIGCREEAERLDDKPHTYRRQVHEGSRFHRRALACDLTDFDVLRIVRDPWLRAVSSYRHGLRWRYHDARMAGLLGRPIGGDRGYSFLEYLDLLERVRLDTGNVHDRIQRHPVEQVLAPTTVVRLPHDDLAASLQRFERDRGGPVTDIAAIDWVDRVERRRRAGSAPTRVAGPDSPLTSADAAPGGPWPDPATMLTDEVRAWIGRLYAADVEAYFSGEFSDGAG